MNEIKIKYNARYYFIITIKNNIYENEINEIKLNDLNNFIKNFILSLTLKDIVEFIFIVKLLNKI